jgi:tail tube protein
MTTASPGYGSFLSYYSGSAWVRVAQLKKFAPDGSKQVMTDQTNLRSAGPFTQPFPAQIDSGEIEIAGVYIGGSSSQATLGQMHGQMALVGFQVTLSDGAVWTFSGYVAELKPWDVSFDKAIAFSGKLRVAGAFTPPSGPPI